MLRSLVIASLALWTSVGLVGCDGVLPNNSGPADDDGVSIVDGGFRAPADGGAERDAGVEPETDGGLVIPPLDGGLPLIDGGLVEYEGEAEVGVRCGETLEACPAGAPCCVALEGFSLSGQCGEVPAEGAPQTCDAFTIGCDDRQEDCTDDNVCCFILEVAVPLVLGAGCMPAAQCAAINAAPDQPSAAETCLASSDCGEGQLCCGVDVPGFAFPLDLGVCQPTCDVALPMP